MRFIFLSLLSLAVSVSSTFADEGMYPLKDVPHAKIEAKYGKQASASDLATMLKGVLQVRLNGMSTGSSSFISGNGLIMTNFHVAEAGLSTIAAQQAAGFLDNEFFAKSASEEIKVPALTFWEYVETLEVTKEEEVTANLAKLVEQDKESVFKLQYQISSDGKKIYADFYKVHADARLIYSSGKTLQEFSPGPVNFDVALFRAYDTKGNPVQSKNHFKIAADGVKKNEFAWVFGMPGTTQRFLHPSALKAEKLVQDYFLALTTAKASYFAKYLEQINKEYSGKVDAEELKKIVAKFYDTLIKGFASYAEYYAGVSDLTSASAVKKAEENLKTVDAWVAGQSNEVVKKAFAAMNSAYEARDKLSKEQIIESIYMSWDQGFGENTCIYNATEALYSARSWMQARPDDKKEAEILKAKALLPCADSLLIDDASFMFDFAAMEKYLGKSHPYMKSIFGEAEITADAAVLKARDLITQTKLYDINERTRVLNLSEADFAKETDPMLLFVKQNLEYRRKLYDPGNIGAVLYAAYDEKVSGTYNQLIVEALTAAGKDVYPDAQDSALRVSYGKVSDYDPKLQNYYARFGWIGNIYQTSKRQSAKAGGNVLPTLWQLHEAEMDKSIPLFFGSDNDYTGGNSGSVVVNSEGKWIGLLHSYGIQKGQTGVHVNNYFWAQSDYGMHAINSKAIVEVFSKVHQAKDLVKEILSE